MWFLLQRFNTLHVHITSNIAKIQGVKKMSHLIRASNIAVVMYTPPKLLRQNYTHFILLKKGYTLSYSGMNPEHSTGVLIV